MIVKIKLLHPLAKVPSKATAGSSGFDLYACFDSYSPETTIRSEDADDREPSIWVSKTAVIPCGFCMEMPLGWEAQIRPRSGLAVNHHVTVLNSPGTIDSDYRGEVKVLLVNHGEKALVIKPGDRIAQMTFHQVPEVSWQIVPELDSSNRSTGGFGSTGR